MLYQATHITRYRYEEPVTQSLSEARLTPRSFPGQQLRETRIHVHPEPGVLERRKDYFGNDVTTFAVFRTHDDTGKKAVYVNRLMTVGVEGIPQAEAEPLLEALFDHAENPAFVYEHVWRVGDLLLWDNRCSSHARRDFPATERRLMLRTTVKGGGRPV